MNQEWTDKIPGVVWGFSQPIEDNMEEAVSGVKGELATKIYGNDLRLRPIMMTMLVATLGLLPAAMSHGIGSDSQRPFAIVIVGGLIANLGMSIFLLPTLYVWIAGENDVLPELEPEFET